MVRVAIALILLLLSPRFMRIVSPARQISSIWAVSPDRDGQRCD